MHNYSKHASVTTMLQHLDLPTLQQRRQHSKIIMLYRITHKLASIPTATYIAPCIRNTQHYILPYARTHVFKTSFFPSTIKIWNNLQPVITNSTTIPQLRQALQSTPTSGIAGSEWTPHAYWGQPSIYFAIGDHVNVSWCRSHTNASGVMAT